MERDEICPYCNQPVKNISVNTCLGPQVRFFGSDASEAYPRILFSSEYPNAICPDCGIAPGGLHHQGCREEICPKCKKVLNPEIADRCFCI